MTAIVGSMMSRNRAISPGTLAPASTTSASVSSGAREQTKRGEGVIHLEERKAGDRGRAAPHYRRGRPSRLGFVEKAVGVEPVAFQRYEKRVRCQVPGVSGDGCEL